jgi:hypothetical protein
MLLSSKRFAGRGGSNVIAMALNGSPYVAAYRFNYVTGWGTKFSDPGTAVGYNNEARGIAWGTDSNRLLLAGVASASLRVYDWTSAGFGARDVSTSITDPNSVKITKDGNYILVSGPNSLVEYNYSSGSGVVSVRSSIAGAGLVRQSAYIMDDEFVVVGFADASISFRIYTRGASPTSPAASPSNFGSPRTFSMSPIVHSSTRMLSITSSNSILKLYPVTTSGTLGTEVTSTVGGNVNAALFDPYGRLIIGFSDALRIYTLDSSGNQTLLATASDFLGGSVRSLAYDEDSDVLFVGSLSAPYITAYRMGGAGFVSKYSNPSSALSRGVLNIAVQYEEAWKNTVI